MGVTVKSARTAAAERAPRVRQRIVDLTFPICEGMTTFPSHWHPMVEVSLLGRHGIENRETRKLVLGTHTGTHCDAPRHFIPGGRTVDRVPLDVLIGPAVVADLSRSPPGQEVVVRDLERQLRGDRPERVILRFDWSERWGTRDYYLSHPFLSQAAAKWLVDRGVRLVAMDTPTPDNPMHGWQSATDSPNHKILLGSDVILVEYLCNLKALSRREVDLVVMPLKIADGDGAPARCVAVERS